MERPRVAIAGIRLENVDQSCQSCVHRLVLRMALFNRCRHTAMGGPRPGYRLRLLQRELGYFRDATPGMGCRAVLICPDLAKRVPRGSLTSERDSLTPVSGVASLRRDDVRGDNDLMRLKWPSLRSFPCSFWAFGFYTNVRAHSLLVSNKRATPKQDQIIAKGSEWLTIEMFTCWSFSYLSTKINLLQKRVNRINFTITRTHSRSPEGHFAREM